MLSKELQERLDASLAEAFAREGLPAISAVVVGRGETLWTHSLGHADLSSGRVADENTIYHLGSVTKVFTALLLVQLRDAGRLRLDDPLTRHLPEVAPLLPPITLRQLASHTSGLPLMPPLDELNRAMQEFPPSLESLEQMTFPSIERILASLPQLGLAFAPGDGVAYSNLGIALLAHALERIAGEPYPDAVTHRLLAPLGMAQSAFSATVREAADRATCYLPFFDPPRPAPFATKLIAGFTPTGALWSSAADMGRFLAFLTGRESGSPVLARASLLEMVATIRPLETSRHTGADGPAGVGIGWFLSQIEGHQLAEHGGADPSTAAYLAWAPARDVGVFVASNTGRDPPAIAQAGLSLLTQAIRALAG